MHSPNFRSRTTGRRTTCRALQITRSCAPSSSEGEIGVAAPNGGSACYPTQAPPRSVASQRTTVIADAGRGEHSARFADDQRDVALGAALVTAVALVCRHHVRPQLGLILRRRPAGPHGPAKAGLGQLDLGMGHQVAVPVRITVISALEATSTSRSPSMTGAVSMVERGRPDVRATVCNSTTGIPEARAQHPAAAQVNDCPVGLAHGFEADVGQGLLQATHGATLSSPPSRIIPRCRPLPE
jgi:hypothetical protein